MNILALWAAGDVKRCESSAWGTYKQWSEAGAQDRKGERASHVVFYKEITVAADEDRADKTGSRLFARATPVFAAEQAEGYAAPALPELPANPVEPIERAEAFVAATGAVIPHGGSRGFLSSLDRRDPFAPARGFQRHANQHRPPRPNIPRRAPIMRSISTPGCAC